MGKAERVIFCISLTALWCLVMPPYVCGIVGIPVVLGSAWIASRRLTPMAEIVKGNRQLPFLVFIGLGAGMIAPAFYERWYLSSALERLAGALGIEEHVFMGAVIAAGEIVAAWSALYLLNFISVRAKQVNLPNDTERNLSPKETVFSLCVSLCIGMRYALNPWSAEFPGTDSAVFLYMGRMMLQGKVAYRDIFDHKGLYIYFMDALGLRMTPGSFTGVWILEIINLFVCAILIFKITKLITNNRIAQYGTVALALSAIVICQLMTDGNLTEEYALPWILVSLYICVKYFVEDAYRIYEIVILGISFAVIVFLRANMIAVFAAWMPLVLVQMIYEKKWRDVGKCAAGFLSGCVVGSIPVLIYCIKTGSLHDMLYYYFAFNMEYVSDSAMPVPKVMVILFAGMTIYSLFLLIGMKYYWRDKLFAMNGWFYMVSLVLASMSGRAHAHYAVILIPALILPIAYMLRLTGHRNAVKVTSGMILITILITVVQIGAAIVKGGPEKDSLMAYITENSAESDDILVMGNNCIYYLECNRATDNKFFFQDPVANNSDAVYEEFYDLLKQELPDMIVVVDDLDELLGNGENLSRVYKEIEEWYNKGIYEKTVVENHTVYQKQKDRVEI